MKIGNIICLFTFLFIAYLSSGQQVDIYFDSVKMVAFNKHDSTLFTGIYKDTIGKGKYYSFIEFINGNIKSDYYYNKKGVLLDSIVVFDNGLLSKEFEYNKNGKLLRIRNFKLAEESKEFFETSSTKFKKDGTKKEEIFCLNGYIRLLHKMYYDNGNIKYSFIEQYVDYEDIYNPIGKPAIDSIYIDYFKTGVKKSEITYKLGKRHGMERIYYENGKLKEERNFIDGKIVNPAFFWDEIDRKYEVTYKIAFNGMPTTVKCKKLIFD